MKDPYGAQGIARVSITAGTPASSAPIIVSFTANPTTINAGQSSTLSWQVQNADTVVITTLGSVALSGSQAVTPATTTTYTLTATHGTQTATAQATVTVNAGGGLPVIVSFAPNPATVDFGQSSSLQWVVQNATTVTIDNSIGTVGLTGSHSISPAATTTYTITASNAIGTVTAKTTLTVITSVQILSFTGDTLERFVGGHLDSGMRNQRRGIGECERGRIHDRHGGGIGARDYHHYLQLHGDSGGRPDGFGANYGYRGRADRSGVIEVTG